MNLKSKFVSLVAISVFSAGVLSTMGGSVVHAEKKTTPTLSKKNSILMNANKESILLNALSDQERETVQDLLNQGNEFALSKFLAEIIYSVGFSNRVNDTKGTMAGGSYEKEFNENVQWFKDIPKDEWTHDGLKAFYLKNPEPTEKTVVLVHGFSSMPNNMGAWVKIYYDLGYNVLTPELRAHGSNTETVRSLGWKDKDDIVEWTHVLNEKNEEPDSEIILSGVSMGAATVMMSSTAGLPNNIKGIIEDCGYTGIGEEMKTLIDAVPLLSTTTKINIYNELNQLIIDKQGFSMEEASAVKQVEKSTIPLLLIHGDSDYAVPTNMAKELYAAAAGEKELLLVKGADHPKAILYDLPLYTSTVANFLNQYTK